MYIRYPNLFPGFLRPRTSSLNVIGSVNESNAEHYAALLDVEDPKVHLHAAECFLALQRFEDAGNALHSVRHVVADRPEHVAVRDRAETLLQLLENDEENMEEWI